MAVCACALKKKTLAQAIAAVAVVAVVGGGYVVPMCSYGTMMEQSRSFVENFINQNMIAEGENPVSVALYEDDIGLFSHDVTFVATDGDVKVKVPFTVSLNYGGYDFAIDLVQATINDANAIKSFDLTTLTALNLTGSYSLWNDQGLAQFSASYLNDDVSGMVGAVNQIKERIGYKPVGTVSLNLGFDQEENFTLDFTLDHILSNYAAVSDLSYHSETQGFFELTDIGRNDLAISRFSMLGMSPMIVEDIVFKSEGTRPSKQGIFNLPYELKVGSARLLKNLHFTGTLEGLSLKTFNSPEQALESFGEFLPHPVTIKVDQGSRFDYVTMVRPDQYSKAEQKQVPVEIAGSETLEVKDIEYGQYLDMTAIGEVKVGADVNLITGRSLMSLAPLFAQFKVKDGVSQGTIEYRRMASRRARSSIAPAAQTNQQLSPLTATRFKD